VFVQDHYPDTIGAVIIAPVNTVLYVIWGLVSFILDDTTKSRMKLIKVLLSSHHEHISPPVYCCTNMLIVFKGGKFIKALKY
jgi:hypothetical protein